MLSRHQVTCMLVIVNPFNVESLRWHTTITFHHESLMPSELKSKICMHIVQWLMMKSHRTVERVLIKYHLS